MPKHHGDKGDTSLFGGERVRKTDVRIVTLGDIDELNSVVGQAVSATPPGREQDRLKWVQQQLFSMGSELANPAGRAQGDHITAKDVHRMDGWIDAYRTSLPPLHHFVLPSGSAAGAAAHVARSVCRRAERSAYILAAQHPVNPPVLSFLNRLSDVLFEMARQLNMDAGISEVEWLGPRDRPGDPST